MQHIFVFLQDGISMVGLQFRNFEVIFMPDIDMIEWLLHNKIMTKLVRGLDSIDMKTVCIPFLK